MQKQTTQSNSLNALFDRIVPFRFLRTDVRKELMKQCIPGTATEKEVLITKAEEDGFPVYLLESGSVEVLESRRSEDLVVRIIDSGHYFGEWEALFEVPRRYTIRAVSAISYYKIERSDFLSLFEKSPSFAQGFATILRDRQGIFSGFDHFKAEVLRQVGEGHIELPKILPLYRRLKPALHPNVFNKKIIDFGALLYAIRRLPENVTSCFAYFLTDEIPQVYAHPDRFFTAVETAARRRDIWEMLPGKNLILLRTGISDLMDFITTLCLFAVEAEKIRRKLQHPEFIRHIDMYLREERPDAKDYSKYLKEHLPFEEEEITYFRNIWPEKTVKQLFNIFKHKEMFSIDIQRHSPNYHTRRSDLWTGQISAATLKLTGMEPAALPDSGKDAVGVHIISSNTHSVINCLHPWTNKNAMRIIEWAKKLDHPLTQKEWKNNFDLAFALQPAYLKEHPDENDDYNNVSRQSGILRLQETASTGIEVQMVDMAKLQNQQIDPALPQPADQNDIIVNIDYAFGEQAEDIIRNLIMLFGTNIRSISLFGKAGALKGRRGDILVPTAFIMQSNDLFEPVPNPGTSVLESLKRLAPGHSVFSGPMLTVEGTLLQNSHMLEFYKHIWGVIGLEMEGCHYYRQIIESKELGVIHDDVSLQFYYYVSDRPGQKETDLSVRLDPSVGIPPLYAITRQILTQILQK